MCDQIKKICSSCEEFKILDDFHKGDASHGRSSWCKDCMSVHNKKKREEDKEKNKAVYDSYDQFKDTKVCLRCHQELLVSSFTKNLYKKDALASYCKGCVVIMKKHREAGTCWRIPEPADPEVRSPAKMSARVIGGEKEEQKNKQKERMGKIQQEKIKYKGNVYLMINNLNGRVKIGITKNKPKYRERALQSQEPDIKLLFHKNVLFMRETERYLHKLFDSRRFRGEWFDLSKEEIEEAKSIIERASNGSIYKK